MWLKWEKCKKARYVRKRDLWEKKWAKFENVREAQKVISVRENEICDNKVKNVRKVKCVRKSERKSYMCEKKVREVWKKWEMWEKVRSMRKNETCKNIEKFEKKMRSERKSERSVKKWRMWEKVRHVRKKREMWEKVICVTKKWEIQEKVRYLRKSNRSMNESKKKKESVRIVKK